jgi:hypothetical protein
MEATSHNKDNHSRLMSHDKRRLFSDHTYQLLVATQNEIFNQTEFRVSLRRLLETLITESSLQHVKEEIVNKLNR